MSIVLNEYEWTENKLRERSLGKKPMETLSRVARYYADQQYSKREVRKRLDAFLLQCDPDAPLAKWSDALDRVAKNANRYKPVKIDGITITESELAVINEIKGAPAKRLAFTLLCVSKYWDAVSTRNDHWVNTPDNEILKMANVSGSLKRQSDLFRALRDAGLIQFSKKIDNLNVRVLFSDDGKRKIHIRDFRNLGYQYEMYCGGHFYECANCGLIVRAPKQERGPKPKYCQSCAVEVRTKQNVNAVMRHRQIVS